MHLNADSITIESDERGFELHVLCDDGEAVVFNIQNIDLDAFYDQVKGRIGPYLREMHEARQAVASGVSLEQYSADMERYGHVAAWRESEGYDLSDPKHENFHSVHADIWDARDGK